MGQMNRDQMRMDQRQMDSRMYSMEGSDLMMDRRNMMNMDNQMMRRNQMMGSSRRMMKREAGTSPAFAYTIMTEHPSEMTRNMMNMEELRQTGRMSYRIPSAMRMMMMPSYQ